MMLESQSSALTVSPIPPQVDMPIMLFLNFLSSSFVALLRPSAVFSLLLCIFCAQINPCLHIMPVLQEPAWVSSVL